MLDTIAAGLPPIYRAADLYDAIVRPGPCEAYYLEEARRAGGPVLELACGTGRLTLPLARAGHQVVGLDAAPEMLDAAARKARAAGLAPELRRGDMRDFDLGRRFGLVVLSCNSLAHLTDTPDILACLGAVRRHLAPGGVFAFDVVQPDPAELAASDARPRRLDLGPNPSSAIPVEEVARYDPVAQIRTAAWHLRAEDGARIALGPFALRQFFPQELPLLLGAAGLDLVERHGDFARGAPTRSSLNQICLARAAT